MERQSNKLVAARSVLHVKQAVCIRFAILEHLMYVLYDTYYIFKGRITKD